MFTVGVNFQNTTHGLHVAKVSHDYNVTRVLLVNFAIIIEVDDYTQTYTKLGICINANCKVLCVKPYSHGKSLS